MRSCARAGAVAAGAFLLTSLALMGCGDDAGDETAESVAQTPAAPEPASAPPEPTVSDPELEEACARILIVAHEEAQPRPADVTRTREEGRERIEGVVERLDAGESFEALAQEISDGRSTGARGGLAGTYARSDWPPIHADIIGPLYALSVGQRSSPVDAEYGWVLVQRCEVEKIHIRHILIRFAGARNAPEGITRSEEDAEVHAEGIRQQVVAPGASFEALAREHSEDGSAEQGGDLGPIGAGVLFPSVEDAALGVQPGEITGVVRSPFGFHIIQRVE